MTTGVDRGDRRADAIVVGAGPAGSAAAYYLAQAGLDVLLLEKSRFPREKVCGDGLTPRAVRELVAMGVDVGPGTGWVRNRGLRIHGGGASLQLDWPELAAFPSFGLVRPRLDLDDVLARRAAAAGARLHQATAVTGPVLDERTGRVVGVTARDAAPGRERSPQVDLRAPVVVAADGVAGRLGLALGLERRPDRPVGVAVRTYVSSARHAEEYLETWLDVRDPRAGADSLLPGYGWVFPMGDGTCNVGVGVLTADARSRDLDYRALLRTWTRSLPGDLGPERWTSPVRGAALPAGFSRLPQYTRGLLLVGDAAGMVNPFSGEGISYAMESGRLAAEIAVQALALPAAARDRALQAYPRALVDSYGGYFALGRTFVRLIDHPAVMRVAVRRGLGRPALMRFVFRLLANLTDPHGDAADRVVAAMTRIARSD